MNALPHSAESLAPRASGDAASESSTSQNERITPASFMWRQRVALDMYLRAVRTYAQLSRVRGISKRTVRRLAAAGMALAAAALLLGGSYHRVTATSAPGFGSPSTNPFGLTDVGEYNVPTFVDIDSDGDLDVFSGRQDGDLVFFNNTGSMTAPAFAAADTSTGLGTYSTPAFADIDNDGDLDFFLGDASGNTFFQRNTGSATVPAFSIPSTNPFGLSNVGTYNAPTFADIDGDGDLDAFFGELGGSTFFFRNTGSATAPAFAAASANPFGLSDVGADSFPRFVDIDRDGDLDAFIGQNFGDTYFFSNTGTVLAPAFAAPSTNPFGLSGIGQYSAPAFADINGDGELDAFIGELSGNIVYFPSSAVYTRDPFRGPTTNPFGLSSVGQNSEPTFVDIDGDGDLDVYNGESFFRNTGSALAPAFAVVSSPPHTYDKIPTYVDIDGDGDLDGFIGDEYGSTFFLRNTGSATAPAFAAASTNPFGLSSVGRNSAPAFVDIDGDGDLDGFLGNNLGVTYFFRNTGSATAPAFAAASSNPFGLPFVEHNSKPTFVDFDNDGDLDAFTGGDSGNIFFFGNTGSATAPAFTAAFTNPFGLSDVGRYSRPVFADIDGDGDLDTFVGETDNGNTLFFRAAPPCVAKPDQPTLLKPKDNGTLTKSLVKFDWSDADCATSYQIIVKNAATNKVVFKDNVTDSKTKTNTLPHGKLKWFVKAINGFGKTKSKTSTFDH